MAKPTSLTFIGIGAQKCASSWIYDILADHPQAVVSAVKELDFFSYHYENGIRWYESQFQLRPGALAVGEVSPSYFHEPAAPDRAHHYNPDLQVVVSLRDPVDRALSQHRHMARLGRLPANDLSFESALADNPTYFEQGCYNQHLLAWMQRFGKERTHVVLMDDIKTHRRQVAQDLYRFLNIDTTHESRALDARSNESYVMRSRGADRMIAGLRNGLQSMGLAAAWRGLGNLGLRQAYRAVNRQPSNAVIPTPRVETLASLRERLRPEIEALSRTLNRDLSHWLSEAP